MTDVHIFSLFSNTSWGTVEAKIKYVWSSIPTHGSATDNPLMLLICTMGDLDSFTLKALNPP